MSSAKRKAASPLPSESAFPQAVFKLCGVGQGFSISFELDPYRSVEDTEAILLHELGCDGAIYKPYFHANEESCAVHRPVSDLIYIWHDNRVNSGDFCLHIYKRTETRNTDRSGLGGEEETLFRRDTDDYDDGTHGHLGVAVNGEEEVDRIDDEEDDDDELVDAINGNRPQWALQKAVRSAHGKKTSLHSTNTWKHPSPALMPPPPPIEPAKEVRIIAQLQNAEYGRVFPRFMGRAANSFSVANLPELLLEVYQRNLSQPQGEALRQQLAENKESLLLAVAPDMGYEISAYLDFEGAAVLVPTVADLVPLGADKTVWLAAVLRSEVTGVRSNKIQDLIRLDHSSPIRLNTLGVVNVQLGGRTGLPIHEAFVGALIKGTRLQIGAVTIWTVNGLNIGDAFSTRARNFDKRPKLFEQFVVDTKDELMAMVRAHEGDDDEETRKWAVTAPSYSFAGWTRPAQGVPKPMNIYISVRCVVLPRHVGVDATFVLPSASEMVFELQPDRARRVDVEQLVRKAAHKAYLAKQALHKAKTLRGFGEDGEMTLWVLPQIKGTSTLYKWTDEKSLWFNFARYQEDGTVDGRFYVEAHVMANARGAEMEE